MKEYKIEIVETLARIVTIEAKDYGDALGKLMDDYHNAEVVLDYDDFLRL